MIRVHSSIDDIDAQAWDELLGPQPHPFLRHCWFALLERSGSASPETGWIPRHLTVWEDGLLVAAAPVYIKLHSMGEFVYDWSWARLAQRLGVDYYPKLVVAVPFTPVSGPRLLTAAGREDLRELLVAGLHELCRRLECHGIHVLFDTGEESESLKDFGARTRLQIQSWWQNETYSDFEAFLMQGLTRKRRKEVRRERRRLAEGGVSLERFHAPSADHLREMARFYRRTCRLYGGHTYLLPPFWDALPESPFLDDVQLTLGFREGLPISGALNVQGVSRLFGRYWGCSEERPFLHFETCYYQGIEHSIQAGLMIFEPGHGGRHKRPRGFQPRLTFSSHWLPNKRLFGVIDRFLAEESAAVCAQLTD